MLLLQQSHCFLVVLLGLLKSSILFCSGRLLTISSVTYWNNATLRGPPRQTKHVLYYGTLHLQIPASTGMERLNHATDAVSYASMLLRGMRALKTKDSGQIEQSRSCTELLSAFMAVISSSTS
eukprot:4819553-Amphidinium_carterae.1